MSLVDGPKSLARDCNGMTALPLPDLHSSLEFTKLALHWVEDFDQVILSQILVYAILYVD